MEKKQEETKKPKKKETVSISPTRQAGCMIQFHLIFFYVSFIYPTIHSRVFVSR